jgi:hypothetical protein
VEGGGTGEGGRGVVGGKRGKRGGGESKHTAIESFAPEGGGGVSGVTDGTSEPLIGQFRWPIRVLRLGK